MAQNPLALNGTSPAAPSGKLNVKWQAATPDPDPSVLRDTSAYVEPATATTPGLVPTPPNDATQVLKGDATWGVPPAGTLAASLTDVVITSPSNNDVLTYETSSSKWKNKSASAGIDLQTNSVDNGSQIKLNLKAGTNVTLTDDGSGGVTIASSGGGGGGGDTPADLSGYVNLNRSAGTTSGSGPSNGNFTTSSGEADYVKAIPGGATTWSIQGKFKSSAISPYVVGLILWNSSSNKTHVFVYLDSSSYPHQIFVQQWNGGSFNATVLATNFYHNELWFRASADGTNMYFYISPDGANWFQVYSEALATWESPTHYGLNFQFTNGSGTILNLATTP